MEKGTVKKLISYFFETHKEDALPAMREFFEDKKLGPGANLTIHDDREEGLFMEWIVFDYRLQNGRKLIEDYLFINDLSRIDRLSYENLQMNKYGMYEILEVKKDEYLKLESLQSGKVYKVLEKAGTQNANPKTTWFCRVGKVDDHWELVGSDPIGFPVYHTNRAKEMYRNMKGNFSPKDARKLFLNNDKPTKFEKTVKMKDAGIAREQTKTRNRLNKQLIKSKSDSGVEDILKIVYKEKGNDDMTRIIDLLTNNHIPTQKIIDLASDAWNYFLHRSLGGKSPAEKAVEIYGK